MYIHNLKPVVVSTLDPTSPKPCLVMIPIVGDKFVVHPKFVDVSASGESLALHPALLVQFAAYMQANTYSELRFIICI